jgi:hypothetical protein
MGSFAILTACVTQPKPVPPPPPPNTTVFFYPTRGQSPEQQDRDRYDCHVWAVQQTGFDPSAPNIPPHPRVQVSGGPPPGAGVATGAVAGGLIGAAVAPPWQSGQGALLGALTGAIVGGAAQSAAQERARTQAEASARNAQAAQLEEQALGFRRAMSACLEGRGYSVR